MDQIDARKSSKWTARFRVSRGGDSTGAGENGRRHRLTRLGMAVLAAFGLCGAGGAALLFSTPAGALPTATCTWTGTTNGDWSVGTNWSGGASCTVAGGPVAGAAIVFPHGASNETVTYDSGSESAFDSITFEDPYTVNAGAGAPAAITLTPTAATPCGASTTIALCQSAADSSALNVAVVLGESEEFAAHASNSALFVFGDVSGPGPLVVNDATNVGGVALAGDNTYTGGTTISGGFADADNPTSFGDAAGPVTDDSGAIVEICDHITVDYTLHLGGAAILEEDCATATWSGPITVDSGGAELFNDDHSTTFTVSGNISGSAPLTVANSATTESVILSGDNSYSGAMTVDSGATLVSEPAIPADTPLGTGSVTVDSGGTLEGTGPAPSIDNSGTLAPGTTTTPGDLTSSGADNLGPGTVDVAITGSTAGSGYTQLVNSTSEVDVAGATLAVNDTYSAPYGTVFDVVSVSGSASEVGAFAGDPSGTVINSNGHLLKVAYSGTTGVTLTDVTNPPSSPPPPAPAATSGYRLVASDGGLFSYNAPFDGSEGGHQLNQPIVGMAADSATGGYYEVASDGGIFAFNAPFYGSTGGQHLNAPIVGIAFDPATGGYYEVASDGGIFAYHASFHGSEGGHQLNQPIVGIAFDSATGGYYEVASDGGIFAFDAPFYGSEGGQHLNKPIVGIAFDSATGGYYEVASDGGIFNFNAPFQGSAGGLTLNRPVVGMSFG